MTLRDETSPLSRALLTLELIQNEPGIGADRIAERLGVSDRAARRYVALLREAEVPIESSRGPYGGYRVGRGLRLPPLMFTAPEALELVMALVEGPHATTDNASPVGSALGKIVRVLPERVGAAADTVLRGSARARQRVAVPDPDTTSTLIRAAEQRRRVVLRYRTARGSSAELRDREMELGAPRRPGRSRGELSSLDGGRTRLTGTTGDPPWFASMLTETGFAFHIHGGPELREVAAAEGRRLLDAVSKTSSSS